MERDTNYIGVRMWWGKRLSDRFDYSALGRVWYLPSREWVWQASKTVRQMSPLKIMKEVGDDVTNGSHLLDTRSLGTRTTSTWHKDRGKVYAIKSRSCCPRKQKQKKITQGIIWREVQEVQNESQVSSKKRNSLVPGKTPSFIRLNEFSILFLHLNPRDNPA